MMNNNQKPFAFKLAEQKQDAEKNTKWQARDGVAVAGCSFTIFAGEWDVFENHYSKGRDAGGPC